jgi:asparagine synthase (glutamine-hydrolysing)
MCGIAGIFGKEANEILLKEMLSSITHRGEQAYQYENKILNNVCIGMNRLGIVDEHHGKQPYTDNNGVYCIFNGEIYNCTQIKNELKGSRQFTTGCDTEVVLQSYLHWGEQFVEKLDGKFAICIVDLNKNIFILARDHIGIKPLYYALLNESVFFSSEIKSFSGMPNISQINMIPPGSIWINGKLKTYYSVPPLMVAEDKANLPELKSILINAVRKRIPSDASKISCLLSGGVDSSIILYIATLCHPNVEAFTFANPNQSADLEAAQRLCSILKIKHTIVSPAEEELMDFYLKKGVFLTESYEPVLVRNAVSYHHLCKAVRDKGYKFVLNGEGADEIFGGYAFFKEVEPHLRDEAIRESLLSIHQTYLQMADRASMFATLEARVPFMDKELINYSMTFPSHFRINGDVDKWALRQLFKDELPAFITERAKIGMNEGAGFGRNQPTESIYFKALKSYYDKNSSLHEHDLEVCKQYAELFKINVAHLEEVYNFARFTEYGYHRYTPSQQRLQLNTALIRDL